jgi:putative tryptophan/tyrosine transport system substrate-binding protein
MPLDQLHRREFITLVGGAAAWPIAARAQQAVKQATIGLLGSNTAAAQSHLTAAFVQRLGELGWIEGRNVVIEYRWAEGHTDRLPGLADELVRLNVDVILTHNTPPTLAAKRATSVIPIVFATAGDAVSTGIVASLARPGGNVTGLSSLQPQTAGKRIEVLRELIPGLRRLAVLTDVGNPFADRVSVRSGVQPELSLLKSTHSKFGEMKISPALSKHSKAAFRPCTCHPFLCCSPTAAASTPSRSPHDYRPCMA